MQERGIALVLLNVKTGGDPTAYGPFDDILSMVPSAELIAESLPHLAENGVYNIFAGVAKGVTANLDLGTVLAKNQRLIGTSGSSLADPTVYIGACRGGQALHQCQPGGYRRPGGVPGRPRRRQSGPVPRQDRHLPPYRRSAAAFD